MAQYYNAFVGADYDKISDFIVNEIHKFCPDAKQITDLGCGSGTLDFLLAKKGFSVIGIDNSPAMLSEAVCHNTDPSVMFVQQDLQDFELPYPTDVMVSTLDCFNYLTEQGAAESFVRCCARNLAQNGILIFDFNTLHKYTNVLDSNNFVYETDDTMCIWENEFDGEYMYYDLTYFVREGDLYRRYEDHQAQRFYSEESVYDMLHKNGFSVVAKCDDYCSKTPIQGETERIVLVAQKV